jgi:type I restriction enzyme M protein
MDSFFEFMVAKAAKGSKGQYFTPRHVIELCVRMLKPKLDETVLDPACGSAGFLVHTLNYVRPKDTKAYCKSKLWGFDMDARATRVAKALMLLAGDESANIIRLNSLLQPSMTGLFSEEESVLTIEDVCRSRMRKHKGFDVILTNPPFAGEVRERQLLEGYTVAAKKSRIERDVLFVERCVQLLRPGGRLGIVLPHNKFAAESFAYLRDFLFRKARILGVVGLGRNTFLPHTHQKASVLLLRKNNEGEKPDPDYNIFFSISERDGEHDLDEIEQAFAEFCGVEQVGV